jgi:hypothetical protein
VDRKTTEFKICGLVRCIHRQKSIFQWQEKIILVPFMTIICDLILREAGKSDKDIYIFTKNYGSEEVRKHTVLKQWNKMRFTFLTAGEQAMASQVPILRRLMNCSSRTED